MDETAWRLFNGQLTTIARRGSDEVAPAAQLDDDVPYVDSYDEYATQMEPSIDDYGFEPMTFNVEQKAKEPEVEPSFESRYDFAEDYEEIPEFSEVVLASDGYPKLFGTLEESEHYLQKVLAEDPLCISLNKQTKGLMVGNNSYDDRTFVRFVS